ncbi:uncharacterized protein EV420DRAFT_969712 [Desarmillaria tabescens]|uniref:Uncharacterized protein n=1 Tax=Armillaria tabescens TaxID=1929756 RepID=A0AA39TWW0_ARMTA|nr:uncharacterized protein EV420DRAFT_969712 [Desarmillaria tabescens]KAK0465614.1 hypothetical protein EV420DRAFT_969712 [Desarmillaria tabescens]
MKARVFPSLLRSAGIIVLNNSPPTGEGSSTAVLRESPTHSQQTSPYETRSPSPSHSFYSSNHSALVAESQPPQLPPQEIPQQMYPYQQQQQQPQRSSNSRHTTPEKSHPEKEAPQQSTRRNGPLILRYEPPQEPQPAAEEHRQARAQAKRGRANQLDPIDELDQTNPLGMRLHHGGPYEAIQKVVKPQNKGQQNRSQRNYDNSSIENLQTSAAPAPFTPFGASLNLTPGQILPHNFQPYVQPAAQTHSLQNQTSPTYSRIPCKVTRPLIKYIKQRIRINISVAVDSTLMTTLYINPNPNPINLHNPIGLHDLSNLHNLINRFCLPSGQFNPLKLYDEVRDPLLQFMRRATRTHTGV